MLGTILIGTGMIWDEILTAPEQKQQQPVSEHSDFLLMMLCVKSTTFELVLTTKCHEISQDFVSNVIKVLRIALFNNFNDNY